MEKNDVYDIDTPLDEVVDLSWDKRDRGLPWMVVERGRGYNFSRMRDYYTPCGRLVATCATERGARNRAGKARASLCRQGLSGRIDIVHRDAVVLRGSSAPYGCMSGTGTSA